MAMDMAHKDHLLAAYHGLLAAAGLLLCVLAELLIFALRRGAALYVVPVSAMLLLGRYRRRAAGGAGIRVGLVDFSCLKPPRRLRLPVAGLLEHLELGGFFDRGSIEFMTKAIRSSGMGNETYLPPALHYLPPASTHAHAIREAHMLFFPALDDLFEKSSVPPSAVGALVVNCSGFCPAPSLAAIIANRYRMRADVKIFNLSGMGCSAGSISVDVAAGLLRAHAMSYAVVVSAEILTVGWYCGKDRGKLLLNCNFRTGCSAALLTNSAAAPVKYRLVNVTRTNTTANDLSYRAGYREEDEEGITGFTLGQGVGRMVSELLHAHLLTLSLSILPWREKARYTAALLLSMRRRGQDKLAGSSSGASAPMPDFRAAADHFCLPSSGKPMILRLGKGLGLGEREMEAALMTFHRFGNQSAASLWYQLAYLEAKARVRKGDTVWHLGIGSGLKANSLVWERVAVADDVAAGGLDALGPWMECIHQYPVWE
ncbi:hypothetical protein CFC21_078656 [Triticum aestivum]|uniref:3-ketoacyl-CoA synthase n=2 Tax=Triticum aestivum TaxID=4565 RepID=A0A9R1HXW9_WHEAT|nr:3-ketoacyl-CoA synthase 4-like [Triticum aestivum]KAF7073709.1 hypothetical protein CFC21_078656 [Triticum aestivum]